MSASDSALEHQFENLEQQHEAATLGMWVFLATEILVFGVLFTGFAVYRHQFPESFEPASEHLNWLIGGINTVVLLGSSLTMALAVHAAQVGRRQWSVRYLVLTALLGTAFMGFKAVEYTLDYREGLIPTQRVNDVVKKWNEETARLDAAKRPADAQQVKLFLLFYYIMTGLHAVHLTIGIGVVFYIAFLDRQGRFSPEYYAPIEVTGLYWHFVDIVWIFLLPLLYLMGTHTWGS